ncbi:unnamed protein product [Peronospora belbahrii]|uniref:P-type ATPase C-terminal domain-containing protein n=1 Tax=Peronospora belbahrii TaxID=622444 RepID=A0AAU9KWA6_9STRA|nr:unnamed protein product [Peronospora belbahrii]
MQAQVSLNDTDYHVNAHCTRAKSLDQTFHDSIIAEELRTEQAVRFDGWMSSKPIGDLPIPATSNCRPGSARARTTDTNDAVQLAHELFQELASQCRTVIACRLSPMQKAQVVSLMKASPGALLTFAVGDGGNDVSMIQEAHVGIGIYGHEGLQAVRAADFAIATFLHLSRLLLVHGRWNHRRVARVILFSFYKNVALIMTLFLYNEFSGQTMYESYLMVGWNVLYTVLPIFVLGITDEDIRDSAVLRFPFVYRISLRKCELSIQRLGVAVVNALFHSCLVFFFVSKTVSGVSSKSSLANGLFPDGTAVYGALIITVTLKASLHMQCLYRWTRAHYISLFGKFVAYILFVVSYSQAYRIFPDFDVFRDFHGLAQMLSTEMLNDIIREIDSGFGDHPAVLVRNTDSSTANIHATKVVYSSYGRQHFRDFDQPSEYDELSKQLVSIQRDFAREIEHLDDCVQEDYVHSSRALRLQPPVHPVTLEFMGDEHQSFEGKYEITFAFCERSRVMLCLKVMAFMTPLYAAYELLWEHESMYIWIRVGYFAAILLPYCIVGMVLTLTISDTGKLAAALYPVGLFVVIRVKFLHALLLSLYNFAFYMLSDRLCSVNYSNSVDLSDRILFALYLVFVITFEA